MNSLNRATIEYEGISKVIPSSHQRGVTLVELLLTLAILAILLSIGVPAYNDAVLGSRLSSHGNDLIASAHLARAEAIKRNAIVQLCTSADGVTCATSGGWQQGWIVRDSVTGEIIHSQGAIPTGFRITPTDGFRQVNFRPTGVGVTYGPATPSDPTLVVCRAIPSTGNQERVIRLELTGRASLSRTTNGACP